MTRLLLIPVLLLPLVALAFLAPGGLQAASWQGMAGPLRELQEFGLTNRAAAAVLYTLLYVGMVVSCIPLAPAMGVAGGAILGPVLGAACATTAATAGSAITLLLARRVLGPNLPAPQRAMIERLRPRLERNGFMVLLALRLTVLTPSWLLNLAAGVAGMRLAPFAVATALGVLPAAVVFTSVGSSLGEVLRSPTPPGIGLLARPSVLVPLLALSVLAALPVVLQRGVALGRAPRGSN